MFSFDIIDNSCGQITINGGPFVGLPVGVVNYSIFNSFTIYPNPSNGKLIIEFKNEKLDFVTIEVYNLIGELKLKKVINVGKTKIDTQSFSNGLYNVVVKSKSEIISSEKLIITK